MKGRLLKSLNGLFDLAVGAALLATVTYAAYSLWDNAQVYRAATDVQDLIRALKPDSEGEDGPSFDELRVVNPDVIAWITLEGTNVDYPVVQGDDNLEYMNKDVYGDFSLAGSIFLDTRNEPDFSDSYSLVYGHDMDEHLMFGDLALYKDREFFETHEDATLMLPGETREMKVAAVLQMSAGTEELFNPDHWADGLEEMPEFVRSNSMYYRADKVAGIEANPKTAKVVALDTCSSGSTDDRTVVLLSSGEEGGTSTSSTVVSGSDDRAPKQTGNAGGTVFWYGVIAATVAFVALFETVDRVRRKAREG